MIYEIIGKLVILDSDLSKIYKCKNGTKAINQAVNRNIGCFPKDFYFQLTKDKFKNFKSQIVTVKISSMSRVVSYFFTEQGVAILATVLHTSVAALMSVKIM